METNIEQKKEPVKINLNVNSSLEKQVASQTTNSTFQENDHSSLESSMEKIFGGKTPWHSRIREVVNHIKMIPYYVFSGVLFFAGISLIPQNKIMNWSKVFLPLFLSIIISFMLISAGVFISIPTIDEILFDKGFSPIMGIIPGIIVAILMFIVLSTGGKILNKFTKNKISNLKEKNLILYALSLFTGSVIFIGLVVFFSFLGSGGSFSWQVLGYFFNSFLGYLIYFGYIYLTINLVFLLYKKVIYLIFSLANREMSFVQKHIFDIIIYVGIILLINGFLNIKVVIF